MVFGHFYAESSLSYFNGNASLGQWSTGQPVPFGSLAEDEDLTSPQIVADKADLFLAYATVPGYR